MNYCPHCGASVVFRTPPGDTLPRHVCTRCETIHYQNPKVVVGSIVEWDGKILLCRRAIEPRHGLWTLPAGFMENAESTLLKLQLSGFITPEGRERLDDIERVVASRFFWGETDFGGLAPAPEDDSWIEELPPGVLREVGKRLRTESVDSRVRTKALLELYSLITEARE